MGLLATIKVKTTIQIMTTTNFNDNIVNFILYIILYKIMSLGGACRAIVFPLVAMTDQNQSERFDANGNQLGGQPSSNYLAYTINLAIIIGAAYLAWFCNDGETMPMRILYTVLAGLFSGLYLIYYLIYRVAMGNSCK